MNLVIDIGNSRTKYAIFDNDRILFSGVTDEFTVYTLESVRKEFSRLNRAILSSTKNDNIELISRLQEDFEFFIQLGPSTRVPVINRYKTPQSLGPDRLSAVVGANYLYPASNVLVIDAGSAITYDLVLETGEYIGGNISPGLAMRFKALNNFTGKLPLVESRGEFQFWGDTTETAIRGGVQNGILFEIEAYIDHFKKIYNKIEIIFTGGDANFFESNVKNYFFVHSNLVAVGLNRILEYNAEST